MRLLMVDDNVPFLEGMVRSVDWEQFGVIDDVLTAYSMKQAMERLERQEISLLVTDIRMDQGSGLELLEWMNEKNFCFASIIISSFSEFRYAQKAVSLGVTEYLLKPMEPDEFCRAVYKAIHSYEEKEKKQGAGKAAAQPDTENARVVRRLKEFIEEHISGEIGRSQLAEVAGFNPEYLSVFFRKETGQTLTEYIRERRLTLAAEMLAQTNLSISVISQNCGFETLSYFSNLFRQKTGMTPREYRKQRTE